MAHTRNRSWPETLRWWWALASALWLAAAAACLAAAGLHGARLVWWLTTYLGLTVVASPICFAAYGIDKRRAARQRRRVPERVLHLLALIGGWPGAVLAQHAFRHKTQKVSFRLTLGLIIALHAGLILYGLYSLASRGA